MSPPLADGAAASAFGTAALLLLKSTLLLGAAATAAWALRRASAASRHLLWSLALLGLLALPWLTAALPSWRPALLAVRPPATLAPVTVTRPAPAPPARFVSTAPAEPAAPWASVPATPADAPRGGGVALWVLLAAVWTAGAAAVLARLVRGVAEVRALAREAEPVSDPAWTEPAARLAQAVGVRRPVRLFRSRAAAMPMTWGARRPAVLLPADADGWSAERRRVVLLHELAHVARRDCLTQTLAEVACALWWFHPGAWWAARRMRREREQACDDLVLAAGARASDYATHLVDVARAYRGPAYAAGIAMARPSHLEDRVRAVLDAERDRRAVTARTGAVCAGAVLLAVLPLAAVVPSERREEAPRRVSLVVPVRAEMDGSGKAVGRGRATTRIDGTDVQLDVDVRVTVESGAEVDVDDQAERIPAFATPLPIVQASAPAAPPPAPAAPPSSSPALADFRVEGMRVVLRENLVLELTDGSGAREVVDLRRIDPEVREAFLEGAARVAVAGKRGAARLVSRAPSVPAGADADDCPEKRRAREVGEAVARMALEGDGDAGRIASRVLGEIGGGFLADAISALVSDADGV